ncbi:MAG: methyltransferase domain-containing protein [Myxococcales bacterium]|nr:MAG: methyltransferase domain-containing protein [Myxococcales bacterium]
MPKLVSRLAARMRHPRFFAALPFLVACAASPPPAAEPEQAGHVVAATPPPLPSVSAPPAAVAPPPPSPEEKKRIAEQQALEKDFAKLEADQRAELSRLTPELRKQTQDLAQKQFASTKAALTAIAASPHRKPGSADRDPQRHPQQMLEWFGVKPTQTVLEYGPGEGWWTELLAPLLAKRGKLFVTETDPNGPKDQRPTLYGQRTKYFLEALPEAYGNVQPVIVDPKAPSLASIEGKVDVALVFRSLHGMNNSGQLGAWLRELHRALKPNGVLGIEQHRAAAGQNPSETSKRGYLPEAFVIEQVEAAGFKLAAKSELNANPKDTKDYPEGVWSLPPTLREGEKNRDKYLGIGESDRMTLKFVKVAQPAAR